MSKGRSRKVGSVAEPKSCQEEIAQARAAREGSQLTSEKRRAIVAEQIADALVGIKWALRSGTNQPGRMKRAGDADKRITVVVGTRKEYEALKRAGEIDDDARVIVTGVPRSKGKGGTA